MQIVLVQAEIETAIRNFINQQIALAEGQEISIDLTAGRGAEGFKASIDIVVAGSTPVTATPAPAPVARAVRATPRAETPATTPATQGTAASAEAAVEGAGATAGASTSGPADEPWDEPIQTEPPVTEPETQAGAAAAPAAGDGVVRKPLFGKSAKALG